MKHRNPAALIAMDRLWDALDEVLGDWTNEGKPVADEETINRDEQELKEALEAFRKIERRGWK